MLRVLLAIACVLAGVGLGAVPASAHANYLKSTPAADARLPRAPAEVRITFTEPPDLAASSIEVLDESGRRYDTGAPRVTGEENELAIAIGGADDGGYVVSWSVLSTADGHVTKGSFAFAVGDAPLPAIPDVGETSPPPSPGEVLGRALSFAGIALVLGGAIFGALVRVPRSASERLAERQLLFLGGGALAAGAVLLMIGTNALPQRLGLLYSLRAGCGLVGVALACTPDALLPAAQRRLIVGAAGLAAGATAMLVSHAAASTSPFQMALDLLHIVAISIWVGGLASMIWGVLRRQHATIDDAAARSLGQVTWRFSLLALIAIATLITTGALQSLNRLVLVQDLVETPFGLALLAKVALVTIALGLGALNLLVWGPRLRRAATPDAARRGLVRGTIAESALLSLVIVASALLTSFVPPAQPSGAAYDAIQHVEGLRLQLLLASTSPERNRYVLRIHQGLSPVAAERVTFRFTMIEHDMGEQELVAVQRAPGEYAAEGNATFMTGRWRIQAMVRLPGRADVRATFEVPVFAEGTLAKAVQSGPYVFVLFVDPANPGADAPLTLNVILTDGTGDPATGRQLTATLTGPATLPAMPARDDGFGRYVFELPPLAPGAWQATVRSGTEAEAVYGFDVVR